MSLSFVLLLQCHCRGHHLQEKAGNSGAIQPSLFQCRLMHRGQHHCYKPASNETEYKKRHDSGSGLCLYFSEITFCKYYGFSSCCCQPSYPVFLLRFLVLPWRSGARIAAAIEKGERKMIHAISLISQFSIEEIHPSLTLLFSLL